ncbi:MAG: adenosylcobinamide-phosphate synthase CbiB [Pseudomonadota bacterium]
MTFALIILLAWLIEIILGWPNWLYKRMRHPVVWLGAVISKLEKILNRTAWTHRTRYVTGALTTLVCVGLSISLAWSVSFLLPPTWWGFAMEALIASSLIASRSLYEHVAAVSHPLAKGKIEDARHAVSMIVGRDPSRLDENGIARASLESLAENTSDGVIAPILWGAVFGLPGLAAYKAINTFDSMIGHKNERYAAFGGFAARLDDIANLVPARLTGLLFCVTSLRLESFGLMIRNARNHRSPNAGWPEAAMAGGLGVKLSGPRIYDGGISVEPWLNPNGRDPAAHDIRAGLMLFVKAMFLALFSLAIIAFGFAL